MPTWPVWRREYGATFPAAADVRAGEEDLSATCYSTPIAVHDYVTLLLQILMHGHNEVGQHGDEGSTTHQGGANQVI